MKTDIEIARSASAKSIQDIGQKLNIPKEHLLLYGPHKAKIDREFLDGLSAKPDGKLVLVTAISPTPAGEGKTTTTVGLNDALNRIGKKSIACLREPSLGPCFGMKGGAAGGGFAQIIPMEDINLHFTGDFHAIGTAHNLLSAMIDNSLYWGNSLNLNPRSIEFKRVMDMNDRALREIVVGLGKVNGSPREAGFDITVASEVMAILCLSRNRKELTEKLGKITVGFDTSKKRIFAKDLQADGAMSVLLKDALLPNLVQSLENNPAIVHGGPFANIAHGCNSIAATSASLKMAEYTITEAGFGADLGAEKFFDIKCRKFGLKPTAAVVVATVRALKMHGGVAKNELGPENIDAVKKGMPNLIRHIENVQSFGVPVIVAINHFAGDTDAEVQTVIEECAQVNAKVKLCKHWALGGEGAEELAKSVVEIAESGEANFRPIYDDELPLAEKIETLSTKIYRAGRVTFSKKAKQKLQQYDEDGFRHFPVCMAKTQYSFSTDASAYGAPKNHELEIKDVLLNTGAEFLVVIAGDIMRMPGLPRVPAANNIRFDGSGFVEGLF